MNLSIESFFFKDDGYYPNHSFLPTLVYQQVFHTSCEELKESFAKHRWGNQWKGSVFDYHHYHSTTHEALAVVSGTATLCLGGPNGMSQDVQKGDLLIIPAGAAHKNLGATDDFQVLGAYPFGESYDLKTGEKHEYEEALKQIPDASSPEADPLFGKNGPLMELWI